MVGGVHLSTKPNLRLFSDSTRIGLEVVLLTFTGGLQPSVKPNLCLSYNNRRTCLESERLGLVDGRIPSVDALSATPRQTCYFSNK